jgi:hypothetical protein
MIGDEVYAQRFLNAVGIKELGLLQVNVIISEMCLLSLTAALFMKSLSSSLFIKLLAQPKITKGCSISLTGPAGRDSVRI